MRWEAPQFGERQLYPYSIGGKIWQFPYKFHWKYARFFRHLCYAAVIGAPVMWLITKGVNSDGNVEKWKHLRAKRLHTPFDPPHEGGGHHH